MSEGELVLLILVTSPIWSFVIREIVFWSFDKPNKKDKKK